MKAQNSLMSTFEQSPPSSPQSGVPASPPPGEPPRPASPPPPSGGFGPAAQPPGNGIAVAGFVLGLAALILLLFSIGLLSPLTLVLGVTGFVLGLVGKRRVDRGATARGRGLAIAGLTLGLIAAVLSLLAVALFTIGLASGGTGDSRDIDGAEATVKEYLGAMVEGEGDDACEVLAAGPRRQLASGPGSRQFGTTGSCEDFVEAQAAAIDRSPGGSFSYDGARISDTDVDGLELRTSIDLTRGLATVRGPGGREPLQLRYDEDEGWTITQLPPA